jgi:glycosyltransferase involved in cell wall biosynthesis
MSNRRCEVWVPVHRSCNYLGRQGRFPRRRQRDHLPRIAANLQSGGVGVPTVSVVMPVHNAADSLRAAIESVLDQSYTDLELLVVDDGSSDESVAIAASFTDTRLRTFFRSTPSGGPSTPRNIALAEATGEWVGFLDNDDLWLPHKLEQQLKLADSDTALVYSRCLISDRGAALVDYHDYYGITHLPSGDCVEPLIAENFVPILTTLVRRSWADRVGLFEPRLAGVDDYDYWLRVALEGGNFRLAPEPSAVHRVHASNLTHRIDKHQLFQLMFSELADRYPEHRRALTGRAREARRRMIRRKLHLAKTRLVRR